MHNKFEGRKKGGKKCMNEKNRKQAMISLQGMAE